MTEAARATCLLPADAALTTLPYLELDAAQTTALFQGKVLTGVACSATGLHRTYGPERRFLGLVKVTDGTVVAERLFVPERS